MSVVTYPDITGIETGGGSSSVGTKRIRTTRFASISSGTSGSITKPSASTIVLDDFGGGLDAVIVTISSGRPTNSAAVDSGGSAVSTSFDSSGNYVLTATPTSYPVALVYRVYQALDDFDSDSSDIVGPPVIVGSSGGVSDGDKGDITVSASGSVWTVDNDAITYAKIQNVSATDKILGRSTAGAGDIEEIACTSAARSVLDDASVSAMVDTLGGASSTGSGGLVREGSPTFTGTPAAPTQSAGDNSTKLATTAYADALVSDTAYDATSWNGVGGIAPSKNAVRDQIETLISSIAGKQASDTQLTSLAALSYTGNALKAIRVNAGETDFELATISGGGGVEVITASLSSQQDNYSISGVTTTAGTLTKLRITPTTSFILTGISSTSYGNGKEVEIANVTSYSSSSARIILIENESGDSTAANRFTYPQSGVPLILMPGDKARFCYNTTSSRFEFVSCSTFGGTPYQMFDIFYDAYGYTSNSVFTSTTSGGSLATSTAGVTTSGLKPVGTMQVSTSTGTADRAFYALRDGSLQGGYGCAISLIRAGLFSALSDGTNTYNCDFGFLDGMAATSNTDAVCWTYSSAVSGDFLTRTTSNNVTTETTVTGFTAATTTMPYFGIFCNGDWTNIEFFYSSNGKDWTFSSTAHTTNIPTGTSRLFGWGTGIRKSAGTTARSYETDFMAMSYKTNRGA